MNSNDGGKGSAPREQRNDKAYSENWEKIFGKKLENEQPEPLKKNDE